MFQSKEKAALLHLTNSPYTQFDTKSFSLKNSQINCVVEKLIKGKVLTEEEMEIKQELMPLLVWIKKERCRNKKLIEKNEKLTLKIQELTKPSNVKPVQATVNDIITTELLLNNGPYSIEQELVHENQNLNESLNSLKVKYRASNELQKCLEIENTTMKEKYDSLSFNYKHLELEFKKLKLQHSNALEMMHNNPEPLKSSVINQPTYSSLRQDFEEEKKILIDENNLLKKELEFTLELIKKIELMGLNNKSVMH